MTTGAAIPTLGQVTMEAPVPCFPRARGHSTGHLPLDLLTGGITTIVHDNTPAKVVKTRWDRACSCPSSA